MNNKKWEDRTEADIAAWWSPDDGKPIIGKLLGLRTIKGDDGRPRLIWVIETHESTMGRVKGEDTPKEFPAGTIIGVGHRAKLAPLVELYATTTGFDVAIAPNKKVKISGGRPMWLLNVKTRGGSARPVALAAGSVLPRQLSAGSAGGSAGGAPGVSDGEDAGEDDIPF